MHRLQHHFRFLSNHPELSEDVEGLLAIPATKLLKGRRKDYSLTMSTAVDSDLQLLTRSARKQFDFANVIEIRRGLASQEVMTQAREAEEADELDPESVLAIYYSVPGKARTKSLNLLFSSAKEATYYFDRLSKIVRALQGQRGELFILSRQFHMVADGKIEISVRDAATLMSRVNVQVPSRCMKELVEQFDADGDHKMNFAEFSDLVRSMRKHPAVTRLFESLQKDGPVSMHAFLESQGKAFDSSNVENVLLNELEMQQLVVTDMPLIDDQESVFDDSQSLSSYLINSSHNTYLSTTDQLAGKSSIEMYAVCCKLGMRCVELDVWDGDVVLGPIVHHGFTLCTRLHLRDVLQILSRHAFEASPYPLILSIENHCSDAQQDVMADLLISVLGKENLFIPQSLDDPLPSLASLKHKFVVKAKMQKQENDRNVTIVSERFRKLVALPIGEFLDCDTCDVWPVATMANVSESKAASLDVKWLHSFCSTHLTRVYPKGTRVDSSNFNPLFFWRNNGAQICAMNAQFFGLETFVNFGFFSQTGSAGYVQRPAVPLGPLKLSLEIHGARNVPVSQRDILDPYVIVSIVSSTGVLAGSRHKSRTVSNNGLNPDFELKIPEVVVEDPSFSVLVIELWDADPGRDDLIAFHAAPVSHLQQGIRFATLFGPRLYPLNRGLAHLLLTVTKSEA